jgi:hypothetical protein
MSRTRTPIVTYELVIWYRYNNSRKWDYHYSCITRDHEANDIYNVIRTISDYTWLENPKSVRIEFVGKDEYIVKVKPTLSYLDEVRIMVRRPMSANAS